MACNRLDFHGVGDYRGRAARHADGAFPAGGGMGLCEILACLATAHSRPSDLWPLRSRLAGTRRRRRQGEDLGHHRHVRRCRPVMVGRDAGLGGPYSGGDLPLRGPVPVDQTLRVTLAIRQGQGRAFSPAH